MFTIDRFHCTSNLNLILNFWPKFTTFHSILHYFLRFLAVCVVICYYLHWIKSRETRVFVPQNRFFIFEGVFGNLENWNFYLFFDRKMGENLKDVTPRKLFCVELKHLVRENSGYQLKIGVQNPWRWVCVAARLVLCRIDIFDFYKIFLKILLHILTWRLGVESKFGKRG